MSAKNTQHILAINGGAATKTTPYGKEQRYGDAERLELDEALSQGSLFYTQGKKVRQMEEAAAKVASVPQNPTESSIPAEAVAPVSNL